MSQYVLGTDYNHRGTLLRAAKVIDDSQYNVNDLLAGGADLIPATSDVLSRSVIQTRGVRANNRVETLAYVARGLSSGGGGGGGTALTSDFPAQVSAQALLKVVTIGTDGLAKLASAQPGTDGPQNAIGIVSALPGGGIVTVQQEGELAGWGGALTVGVTYYLAVTPGALVSVPPSVTGQFVQKIGYAKTSSVMIIEVDRDAVVL